MPLPEAKPPDGATLFKQQCATCHATNLTDPSGKGRRCLGSSAARPARWTDSITPPPFAKADFVWDDARLRCLDGQSAGDDLGSVMAYRQSKPEIRAAIIAFLKELN